MSLLVSPSLNFAFKFTDLATSITNQIIIKAQNLDPIDYWRTGFIASQNDCKALLSSYENRINIKIKGNDHIKKRNFMGVLQNIVDTVISNNTLLKQPSREIPLPNFDGYYVSIEELQSWLNDKEYTYKETINGKRESFEISKLLEGTGYRTKSDKMLGEIIEKTDAIIENQTNHTHQLNDIKDVILTAFNETSDASRKIIVKELENFITTAFETLIDLEEDAAMNIKFQDFKKFKHFNTKIEAAFPLLPFVKLKTTFNVTDWSNEMLNKYGFRFFEVFGKMF